MVDRAQYAFAPPKGRPLHNEVLETHDHQVCLVDLTCCDR